MNIRVLYLAGPGDVIGTFRCWIKGEPDPSEMTVTYSSQFFNVCKGQRVEAYVVASNTRKDKVRHGLITVEHLPMVPKTAKGVWWHLQQILYGLKILRIAIAFRPGMAVVSTGTHWFMLAPLTYFGVKIIPSLHCTLWRKGERLSKVRKFINALNSRLLFKRCYAVLSASNEITRQLRQLIGCKSVPVLQFLPTYDSTSPIPKKMQSSLGGKTHVLYIGRIERNKGCADLLEAIHWMAKEDKKLRLHFCGSGSFIEELRALADQYGMNGLVIFHGHLPRTELHKLLPTVDALVVPTTADFVEGFNQVVVEGVMASVPTITTDICPATEYVKGAVLLFEAGNVPDLVSKLRSVLFDGSIRKKLLESSMLRSCYFYNPANGWEAAFSEVVESVKKHKVPVGKVVPVEHPVV